MKKLLTVNQRFKISVSSALFYILNLGELDSNSTKYKNKINSSAKLHKGY